MDVKDLMLNMFKSYDIKPIEPIIERAKLSDKGGVTDATYINKRDAENPTRHNDCYLYFRN